MFKRLATASALCALVTGLAACGGSSGSGDSSTSSSKVPKATGKYVKDGTFRLSLAYDPGVLDEVVNSGTAKQLGLYAYDALVAMVDDKTMAPNLATKWDVQPRKLVFTVRDGVTCSDRSAVTPSVIAKSFSRYRDSKAQTKIFGNVSDWEVVGDDEASTVTFTFGEPVGFPLQSLADVPIVCGKGLKDPKYLERHTSGSGPYVLTKAVPNNRYIYTRRDGYTWGPNGATTDEPGLPKTVEMRVVTNPSTLVNLFLSGAIDEAALPLSERERLGDKARVIAAPRDIGQLLLNNDSGRVTGEPAVRKALTMGIDRKALAAVAKGKLSDNLPLSVSNPCHDPANGEAIPGYDPEGAARLLDEAGWTKSSDGVRTKNGKRLTLKSVLINDMASSWLAAGEFAAREWRKLGFDVKSSTQTGSAWWQTLTTGGWDVMPLSAIGALNPSGLPGYYTGEAPPKGTNFLRIDNPEYVAATKRAMAAPSTEESCKEWNAGERALYEQANVFPLVEADRLYVTKKNIDMSVQVFGVVPLSVRLHEG